MADMRLNTLTNTLAPSANDIWRGLAGDRLGDVGLASMEGWAARAAMAGRLVVSSDADADDLVLGQTGTAGAYTNTTPTLLLNVPTGSAAIPLWVRLSQSGTVAGGPVWVYIEADNIAAYSSGGTAELLYYFYNGNAFTSACNVYSGATATAGFGVLLAAALLPQDVTPAVDVFTRNFFDWEPKFPLPLVGPACLKVFTIAVTTGVSLNWSVGFADVPAAMFTN